MKTVIRFSPLNTFLMIMMVLSPWLGKETREILNEFKKEEKLEKITALRPSFSEKEKPLPTLTRKERKESGLQNRQVSSDAPARNAKKVLNRSHLDFETLKKENPLPGETVLEKLRMKAVKSKLDSITIETENRKKIATVSESMEEPAPKNPDRKVELMQKISGFAKARDYNSAKKAFIEHLEQVEISPLESLDKLARFKEHFEKLSDHFSDSSSKSM